MANEMTNKEGHKKVWNWLADHAEETMGLSDLIAKGLAFSTLGLPHAYNLCFACAEVIAKSDCGHCPCDWSSESEASIQCLDVNSIFELWKCSGTIADRRRYALQIAKCWREE